MMFDHLLEDYSRTAANLTGLQFLRLSFFSVLSCSFLSFTNSSLVVHGYTSLLRKDKCKIQVEIVLPLSSVINSYLSLHTDL